MAEWKIRRGDDEFAAPDAATIQQWVAEGRVVPSDYVLNPTLNRWMYVSEAAELAAVHQQVEAAKRGTAAGRSCVLAVAMFLFAVMLGMWRVGEGFGMILGGLAIVFAVISLILYEKVSRAENLETVTIPANEEPKHVKRLVVILSFCIALNAGASDIQKAVNALLESTTPAKTALGRKKLLLILPFRHSSGSFIEERIEQAERSIDRLNTYSELIDPDNPSVAVIAEIQDNAALLAEQLHDVSDSVGNKSFDEPSHSQKAIDWSIELLEATNTINEARFALNEAAYTFFQSVDEELTQCRARRQPGT